MDKIVSNFKTSTDFLNVNKYFIGISMIIVNIGARFIIDELDDDTRQYVSNKFVRKLFIFCAFFMATRDILTAFILTTVSPSANFKCPPKNSFSFAMLNPVGKTRGWMTMIGL